MSATLQVDYQSPAFKANPYPTYARLRQESPVHRMSLPDGSGMWLITRYADVAAVLKDPRFVKDPRNVLSAEELARMGVDDSPLRFNMLSVDPPDHTRLRGLVHRAFTAPFIERLRGRVQAIADELIDAVEAKGEMDLIDDFAFPLPILVIAEMLGVPGKDRDRIREWSNALTAGALQGRQAERSLQGHVAAFGHYLYELCEVRRHDPGNDLVSALIQAEEEGSTLNQEELISMVFLLLIAGHETTVNLIGNGMLALFQHPGELEALRQDPTLIKPGVEEMLRYESPVEHATSRFAREDVELGGARISKGELVLAVLGSANRDGEQFEDPDRFMLRRADNKHVAFGLGIHYCLGAPLARMEGYIAIPTLLRRLPDLRLAVAPEELAWRFSMLVRGVQRMPVAFTPVKAETK